MSAGRCSVFFFALLFYLHSGVINNTHVLNVLNYEALSVSFGLRSLVHAPACVMEEKKGNVSRIFRPHPAAAFSVRLQEGSDCTDLFCRTVKVKDSLPPQKIPFPGIKSTCSHEQLLFQ